MSQQRLLGHFTDGTHTTITGGHIGMEIETDFLDANARPISTNVARQILNTTEGRPAHTTHKLELGRQKIELAIAPQPTPALLMEAGYEALEWLYGMAAQFGAQPLLNPEIHSEEELLWVQEERDEIWVALDGRPALEELCRCSSVQFTIDLHPGDAIEMINQLWKSGIHVTGYDRNDARWKTYISDSLAGYRADRYAGPMGFESMADYCHELMRHDVVMHQGQPLNRRLSEVPDADIDLFLRSVWWHYRLRRYGDSLAVEIRPMGRFDDVVELPKQLATVSHLFNL